MRVESGDSNEESSKFSLIVDVDDISYVPNAIALWWISSVDGYPCIDVDQTNTLTSKKQTKKYIQKKRLSLLENVNVYMVDSKKHNFGFTKDKFNLIDAPFVILYEYDESQKLVRVIASMNLFELSWLCDQNEREPRQVSRHKQICLKTRILDTISLTVPQDANDWFYFYTGESTRMCGSGSVEKAYCMGRLRLMLHVCPPQHGANDSTKTIEFGKVLDVTDEQKRLNDIGSHMMCILLACEYDTLFQTLCKFEKKLLKYRLTNVYTTERSILNILDRNAVCNDSLRRLGRLALCDSVRRTVYSAYRLRYPNDPLPTVWFQAPFLQVHKFSAHHVAVFNGYAYMSYKDVWRWIWKRISTCMDTRIKNSKTDGGRTTMIERILKDEALMSVYQDCKREYQVHVPSSVWYAGKQSTTYTQSKDGTTKLPSISPENELVDIEDIGRHHMPPCMAALVKKSVNDRQHLKYGERKQFFPFLHGIGYDDDSVRRTAFALWKNDPCKRDKSDTTYKNECGNDIDSMINKNMKSPGCSLLEKNSLSATDQSGCPFVRLKRDRAKLKQLLHEYMGMEENDVHVVMETLDIASPTDACSVTFKTSHDVPHWRVRITNPMTYMSTSIKITRAPSS